MGDEFQQIQNAISQAKISEDTLSQTLKIWKERKHSEDRSFIVKSVVWLYVISVCLALLYLFAGVIWLGQDRFQDISEVIKIAVLPILTLVVGYYFGTSRN